MPTPPAPPYDPATQDRTLRTGPGDPDGVWIVTDLTPGEVLLRRDRKRIRAFLDLVEGKRPADITSANVVQVVRAIVPLLVTLARQAGEQMADDRLGG